MSGLALFDIKQLEYKAKPRAANRSKPCTIYINKKTKILQN